MSFLSKIRHILTEPPPPRVRGGERAARRRQRFVAGRHYRIIRHEKSIKVDAKVAEKNKLTVEGTDVHDPSKVWVKVVRPQLVLTQYAASARRIHRTRVNAR